MNETLRVVIRNPKTVLFDGNVTALSSSNKQGNFDVLPGHANFITLIKDKPVVLRLEKGEPRSFMFSFAIIHNVNNTATIYTDIELPELTSFQ
ncbi:MAG: hypothetical protein A3F33_03475 [Candidatus Woykebacteria bacterium RIFCSPHIGHO2_12_FULL_43_10]|uniref:ATP synthase F1 complex delta/epsilon subunit N-terminal domain-containing protein n=1 Tax=Candidatus Woykebacteria bacterium RIFCSPLOWO2_01_FULL_43_14 TaxID=1802605 RepID=A0A1G1WUH1_9BACT|nr:MAG: hypothetical protein A2802_02090 [Candidatus Woykebacteria bacterium RIFCSPHIGHO2_01_FULL_43_29]OGY29726.1 MAG: hypothetical protein A3F33_03475 [Candidatus Woykebacteria bacterium RIFCSPHIGHO2_12_FULL_43_10]OGY31386.1 MAG: hypothetical protein A3A61_04060 [Candidatus Woykebacteria bacterium RIFCSPLOWO2_01_FULL_43_14]